VILLILDIFVSKFVLFYVFQIFVWNSTGFLVGPGVSFKALASRTAGMVLSDFCTMFSEAVLQAKDDIMEYLKDMQLVPREENLQNWDYHQKLIELQKDVCSAGLLDLTHIF
jgi:hypothetical protein